MGQSSFGKYYKIQHEIIKHSYMGIASILLIAQLIHLFLNCVNCGDNNLKLKGFPRVINIVLIIVESIFFLAFVLAVAIAFIYGLGESLNLYFPSATVIKRFLFFKLLYLIKFSEITFKLNRLRV